ncbi:hypothetical protein VTO42DRAFT_6939 [Malbranchea cinnamomea]
MPKSTTECFNEYIVRRFSGKIFTVVFYIWLVLPLQTTTPLIDRDWTGNPIIEGWYADPDIHIFNGEYWLYPTSSAGFETQTYYDAFSSRDLLTWTKYDRILDFVDVPWSTYHAAWAPSVAHKNGKYYMYFSAGEGVGIGVAEAEWPGGPFIDVLGAPLITEWHFDAQPIDAAMFIDDDGRNYLYYGGKYHCVVVELEDNVIATKGEYVEITPPDYVEAPFMLKRNGTYYLMYSVGR